MIDLLQNDPRPFLDRPGAVDDLRTYYGNYEGRLFEWFGRDRQTGEPASANQFDAVDMLAVQALGVMIPTSVAAALIADEDESLFRNLATIPVHVELWGDDALAYVEDGGPADDLWSSLTRHYGIGWVIANKLCARKRPNLLPVYDAVVKGALQPTRRSYWLPLRDTLREYELVPVLEELRSRAGLDPGLSLLRVFDVVVWMEARR